LLRLVDLGREFLLPFLEVAVAAGADALVTGNARNYHPVKGRHDVRVLPPRELLDLLAVAK
jgi:hypothetical protein